jgi:thiol:disulfide interchange protein/DsbC/DsbD-like thiol-disulfide interchange protein
MNHIRAFLLFVFLSVAGAAHAAMVDAGHVQVELRPAAAAIAPGGTLYVALHQKIRPGWHTYWRNPGDAGEPPKLAWTLPAGWSAGDIVWPAPKRLPVGPLMDYGYEDEVYLPIPIRAPRTATIGRPARLKADVSLLVCKDICVPETATLVLDLPVAAAGGGVTDPGVAGALAAAPKRPPLKGAMAFTGGRLKLAAASPVLRGPSVSEAYFFPFDSTVIDHAKPQTVERGPGGLTLSLAPGFAFTKGPAPSSVSGVLEVDGRAYELDAAKGALPAAAAGLGPVKGAGQASFHGATGLASIGLAMAFAFAGGLVLNLMPCVFPILSMKALALASHGAGHGRPRLQGLAFLLGVMATFVGLAAVLIAAKAAGAEVGWGFQLQHPGVVAALSLVMLLIGLNLSGVFEAGLSLQSLGAGANGGGPTGAFLTGVLAVVVAAPCTAPAMASAVAYALTRPEWAALAVFAGLGLGFAAPFTALSFAPGLLRRLPKPGPWMDALKKALAFPMYGAAAWLVWVLAVQAGSTAIAAILAAAVVLALAAWLYGAAQRAQMRGARPAWLYVASGVAGLAATGAVIAGLGAPGAAAEEPFSQARLEQLQAQHKPVFVNFTAAWCITCQVNERAALASDEVQQAFARTGTIYLKGDWTRRDPGIAEALAEHGRAGVPLYLVYGKDGASPQVLPQILTSGQVVTALDRAAGRS